MRTGDRIQKFGEADWLNNDKLRKVAEIVAQNEGVNFFTCYTFARLLTADLASNFRECVAQW